MNDRQQRWGSPKAFVKACVRKARHPSEHTAQDTVVALYRRWAWKRDERPVGDATMLAEVVAAYPEVDHASRIHDQLVLPVMVLDEERAAPVRRREPQGPRVQGQVRITRELSFCDGAIEPGTVLDHMVPTPYERRELKTENERDVPGERVTWLVVRWRDRRVRIPGDAAKRVR